MMNTATRAFQARTLSLPIGHPIALTRQSLWFVAVLLLLLVSAFAIIYLKDLNRRLFIQSEQVKQQEIIANEQWTQLLLERGALVAQPRIQTIAEQQLAMSIPTKHQIHLTGSDHPIHE